MSDVVVVDASLALKWVLDEPDSDTAVIMESLHLVCLGTVKRRLS